jgi:predicted Zn-dependent protease with MMP-like domain
MENAKFEELILKYISGLPEKFRAGLKNIEIIVDYDNYSHKSSIQRDSGDITLGLYEGVPNTEKARHFKNLPDIITIYKKSLESISKNDAELEVNLKKVLLHEIGHYYGIDEKKLEEFGYGF